MDNKEGMGAKPKRAKTGGRTKGTPNKVTASIREAVSDLLDEYNNSGDMERDFAALEPRDRIMMAERLMAYVTPKMQAVQANVHASTSITTLDERLAELAE